MFDSAVRKSELATEASYDGDVVGNGAGSKRRLSVSFLRVLRLNPSAPTKADAILCEPAPATDIIRKPKPKRARVQLGSPQGAPEFDRYTYRRFGQLLVQCYDTPNVLKAWCHCGNWTLVTPKELDAGRDCCLDCDEPSPLMSSVITRLDQMKEDERREEISRTRIRRMRERSKSDA